MKTEESIIREEMIDTKAHQIPCITTFLSNKLELHKLYPDKSEVQIHALSRISY